MNKLRDIKYKINIKNIKSSYVIQNIFSFLSEEQILEILMYNKELQKVLSIDIEYYKNKSGKYIIR